MTKIQFQSTSALYKNESAHLNQSVSLKSLNDVHVNNDQLSTLRMAHLQSGTFLLSSTIKEKHLVYSSCDLKWRKLKSHFPNIHMRTSHNLPDSAMNSV